MKAPNWLSHLEFEMSSPVWRHWWAELAKGHEVVGFDQRGDGLSDWLAADMSFDAWASDLVCVVEATGVDATLVMAGFVMATLNLYVCSRSNGGQEAA